MPDITDILADAVRDGRRTASEFAAAVTDLRVETTSTVVWHHHRVWCTRCFTLLYDGDDRPHLESIADDHDCPGDTL